MNQIKWIIKQPATLMGGLLVAVVVLAIGLSACSSAPSNSEINAACSRRGGLWYYSRHAEYGDKEDTVYELRCKDGSLQVLAG